jgi:hypothetical protein
MIEPASRQSRRTRVRSVLSVAPVSDARLHRTKGTAQPAKGLPSSPPVDKHCRARCHRQGKARQGKARQGKEALGPYLAERLSF